MSSSKLESSLKEAIRYASAGVRSRQDVRAYLERRGAPRQTITRVLETCSDRGLLDDRACARLWAAHWARRGYAQSAIAQRLSEKALHATTIEDAINEVVRDSDDETRARAVAAQRLGRRTFRPSRSRLARTLAARGFDPDVIERVLCEAFDSPSSS